MSRPILVETAGNSRDSATWVAEIEFQASDDLSPEKAKTLQAKLEGNYKGYKFGLWKIRVSGLAHLIIHLEEPKQNSSVKTTVERLMKAANVKGTIKCMEAFSGYHRFLMGFPGGEDNDDKQASESPEQCELEDEVYCAEVDKATCKSDLQQAFSSYLSRQAQSALAVPAGAALAIPAGPAQHQGMVDEDIMWINGQPPSLCIYMEHRISEIHKLKWSLLLMKDVPLPPKASSFPTFFTHYRSVSRMRDNVKCLDTAAGHFAQLMEHGGFVGNPSKSLKVELKKAWQTYSLKNQDNFAVEGLCFECNAEIPFGVEGQINTPLGIVVVKRDFEDKCIKDASAYGLFCGKRCCKNRCKGCASPMVNGKCTSWSGCTDDQNRNKRLAKPLGYGKEGEEYISVLEKRVLDEGAPLTWPTCKTKRMCLFHTCSHECSRDCNHVCVLACREKRRSAPYDIPYYSKRCTCELRWFQNL